MNEKFKTTYIVIPVFIDGLQQLVKELKVAYGPDLLTAKVSAAMLINDVLDIAEATDQEREVILGKSLCKRILKDVNETAQLVLPLDEMINQASSIAQI